MNNNSSYSVVGGVLAEARTKLGFSVEGVERISRASLEEGDDEALVITSDLLRELESGHVAPTIFQLLTLCAIYKMEPLGVLETSGVFAPGISRLLFAAKPPRTHIIRDIALPPRVALPVRFDPSFELAHTSILTRMIQGWGDVAVAAIEPLVRGSYSYGFIGTKDYSMYPILRPGAFVQIDESKNVVGEELNPCEEERPIFFVDTQQGMFCCWCRRSGDTLILEWHHSSGLGPVRYGQGAEVVGEVVGVAMTLGPSNPGRATPSQLQ